MSKQDVYYENISEAYWRLEEVLDTMRDIGCAPWTEVVLGLFNEVSQEKDELEESERIARAIARQDPFEDGWISEREEAWELAC